MTADSSTHSGEHGSSGVMKTAWNIPSANGVTSSPVMDAASWPDLTESTRTGLKLSSVNSESSSKAPVISQPPPKPVKLPNSSSRHNANHARHPPMRRGGSVAGASVVGHNRPPVQPPPFPVSDMLSDLEPEFPQPSFKNNAAQRNNNFGPRPVNIGYGGRRDHYGPRSPAARDACVAPQMGSAPVRAFVPYQPLRPYGVPMGSETGASYVYIPTLAHGASGSSMYIPYFNPSLLGLILKQVEYYFSDENLVKDVFLRSHMDDEGWVPIALIAGFQRVQALTKDTQMILSSLTYSNTVEIKGDKIRRRTDWRRWIHIPHAVVNASLQKLSLGDGLPNRTVVLVTGDDIRKDRCL